MSRRTPRAPVLLLLALLGGTIFHGCADPLTPPAGLLPREKFKAVLLEAELLESRASFSRIQDPKTVAADSITVPLQAAYDSLFAAEGVTDTVFKATFDWYAGHPEELKVIYEEIVAELGARKDRGK